MLLHFSLQDGAAGASALAGAFLLLLLPGRALLPRAGELWFGVVTRCVCPGNGGVETLPVPPVQSDLVVTAMVPPGRTGK